MPNRGYTAGSSYNFSVNNAYGTPMVLRMIINMPGPALPANADTSVIFYYIGNATNGNNSPGGN